MEYLTVQETADLKGCSERYIKKLCKDGKLNCSIETNGKNRPKYMIPISSLPEDLQTKYYSQKRLEAGLEPEPVKKAVKQSKKAVKTSFEEFSEAEREEIALWVDILREWQNYRDKYPGKKTEVDKLYVGKCQLEHSNIKISVDILYRKYAAYKDNNLQGLCENRGGANKGKSSIPPEAWEQFEFLYLHDSKPTVSKCYEWTINCMMKHYPEVVARMPSENTFRRHIKTDIPKCIIEYLRDGEKAMKDKCLPHINRMYDGLHANDVWIADNHTFDIISMDEDTGMPHRLYLTAFLEAKSGVIVGWNVTDNPCGQSTIVALRHGIMRFGIPKAVYFDNGREFLVHDIGGKGHRRRKTDDPELEPPTTLQRLGIEMHNAIPKNAKAKVIERTFATLTMQFARAWEGYCGGTIMQRPESLNRRIKEGKIPCDFEIREAIAQWIDYDYNIQAYGGYETKYKGMSRLDVWNKDIKAVGIRKAPEAELNLMLMRSTRIQKIKRDGVFVSVAGEKVWYMDYENTYRHLGKEVYVRYDPANMMTVRVYDKNDKYLWTWKCANELLCEYIASCQEEYDEISDAMAIQHRTEKFIKAEAKSILDGFSNAHKIDLMEAAALKAANGKEKFRIEHPSNVIMIHADEEPAQLAQAVGYDADELDVYLDKLSKNAERRRNQE